MNQKTFLPEAEVLVAVEALVLTEHAPQRVRAAAAKLMVELGRAAGVDLKKIVRPDWQEVCRAATTQD